MNPLRKKESLGIVLTAHHAQAVYLKTVEREVVKIKTGQTAFPTGEIRNGWIQNPAKTAALISKMLKNARISLRRAVVVVPDAQTAAQILDLPTEIPSNMQKFIHTETRYSPVSAKRTAYADYRSLGTDEEGKEKILVGLTSRECISNLVQTFRLAGVEIQSLEMDFCAVYRTVDSFLTDGRQSKNILLAALTGQTLTLSVFLNRKLDFVQRFPCEGQSQDLSFFVFEQLRTVQQFYELERNSSFRKHWQVIVVLEDGKESAQILESNLAAAFGDAYRLYTPENWHQGILPSEEPISPAAFGAAWKGVDTAASAAFPDLLPPEVVGQYAWRKSLYKTAAAAALCVGGLYLSALLPEPQSSHAQPNPLESPRLIQIAEQQTKAKEEVETLRNLQQAAQELLQQRSLFSFGSVLKEIRKGIPPTLQITSVELNRKGVMNLSGKASSLQTIHQFAVWLQQNPSVESAAVKGCRLNPGPVRLYEYRIACRLSPQTGEQTDETARAD